MFSKSAGMKKILLVAVILGIYGLFMCGCGKVSQKVSSNIPNGSNGAEEDVAKPKSSDGKNLDMENKYKNKAVVLETVVDIFREPDINSERVTQAIFNQPVEVIEEKGSWTKVKVVDGYTGWLKSKFIDRDCTSIMEEKYTDRAVITGKTKKVYSSAGGGVTLKDVVMGTELFIKEKRTVITRLLCPEELRDGLIQKIQ